MRLIFFLALLFPALACASDWVELGQSPEVRIMLDQDSIKSANGSVQVWLNFVYRQAQPGQTVTKGKPFDSSRNEYYVACSARKYQVLQLKMYNNDQLVGTFQSPLNLGNLDDASQNAHLSFLVDKICAAANLDVPAAPQPDSLADKAPRNAE